MLIHATPSILGLIVLMIPWGLFGCVPQQVLRPEPAAQPFSCAGPEHAHSPEPQSHAPLTVASGNVTIERLNPDEEPARYRVRADNANLGQFAVALAQATGQSVVVGWVLARRSLSLVLHDATLDTLLQVASNAAEALVERDEGSFGFFTQSQYLRRARRRAWSQASRSPVETRMFRVPARLAPSQLAATYCRLIASPAGRASVVEQDLIVADRPGRLEELERLISTLDPSSAN